MNRGLKIQKTESCLSCKYCNSLNQDENETVLCLFTDTRVKINEFQHCTKFECIEGMRNCYSHCKFRDVNACGFEKRIDDKKCYPECDFLSLVFDKDVIIKKCISELNYIQRNWKKNQDHRLTKNAIFGFLLLSGILFEKFEYNIKSNLSMKHKVFMLRNNLFKKL